MLKRLWTLSPSTGSKRLIWDMGELQWELGTNGVLRHWRIQTRSILSKDPFTVEELVELLPEAPVPLEAVLQQIGEEWQVVESQVLGQPSEEKIVVQTLSQDKASLTKEVNKSSERQPKQQQRQPEQKQTNQTSRVQPLQSDSASQVTHSSQDSSEVANPRIPSELWSSLSQWIPPERFFQPSLHHQADAELSGTPTPTFQRPSSQRPYSQQRPTQYQPPGRGRPANSFHQRNAFQRPRVLPQSKPLLV